MAWDVQRTFVSFEAIHGLRLRARCANPRCRRIICWLSETEPGSHLACPVNRSGVWVAPRRHMAYRPHHATEFRPKPLDAGDTLLAKLESPQGRRMMRPIPNVLDASGPSDPMGYRLTYVCPNSHCRRQVTMTTERLSELFTQARAAGGRDVTLTA